MPGNSTLVSITVTNNETQSLILDEDIPANWTLTPVDNAGATFKPSEHKWLWSSVAFPAGETKTVVYNLTVPSDATAQDYYLSGVIKNSSGIIGNVAGETKITVTTEIHDINVTWIKIIHDTTEIPEGDNLTIGETYKIRYRVNNDGNFDEPEVNITVKLANDTWETTLREHTVSINAGSGGTYTINSWDTTGLTAGVYTITVNASIADDANPADNERTREVVLETAAAESDLVVEAITPKCNYLFANETNNITATIKNNGTADAGAFNVSFDIAGAVTKVSVSGLAAGATTTVYVVDTTGRNAGDSVAITVTADCDGAISESNETNNAMSETFTVYNNGYKGKTYTGGENITTWKTFELKGNLLYSVGDSYYLSGYYGWATASYTVNWTASDLPVPAGATVKEARLYVPYTFDYADDIPTNVSLMFNGATKTFEAHYTDRKGFPKDYGKYGMLVYNVTDDFSASGNNATLTNSNWNKKTVSIRGMVLVVVYAYDSEPKRAIFMNEGFDMLYGGASKCTTPEEATAYAPFSGLTVDTANVTSAELITVAPGAGPNEGELIFNGHKWTDVWNFAGATQIGINETDVTAYLTATENEAAFQSSEDWMEASNAILVVTIVPPNILDYYRCLYGDCVNVSTQELLTAADDWSNGIAPPGFTEPITTQQLMQLADEWSGTA